MKTKVIFRVFKRKVTEATPHDVIAFFPEIPGTRYYLHDCLCYEHIGQHSSATFGFYWESTRPARPEEYASLKAELESIGYDLQVVSKMTRKMHDIRKDEVLNIS